MRGSATFTMETSRTTMNCAMHAMQRISQSGAWRFVEANVDRRFQTFSDCNSGLVTSSDG